MLDTGVQQALARLGITHVGGAHELITGAAGDVGTHLRRELAGKYRIRASYLRPLKKIADETFMRADISKMTDALRITKGVDAIVHLGGYSVEGPWEGTLSANIIGCYNVFEAARRNGVKRILFLTSNHAVGFYRRDQTIDHGVYIKPDSRYGVSKVFGEALGRPVRRQVRHAGVLHAHRQRQPQADRQAAAVDLVQPARPGAACLHRHRSSGHPLRDRVRHLKAFLKDNFDVKLLSSQDFSSGLFKEQIFSAIIFDVSINYGNRGLEIVRNVRKNKEAKIPIVILSSEFLQEKIQQFRKAGADEFLVKPFAKGELVSLMNKIAAQ